MSCTIIESALCPFPGWFVVYWESVSVDVGAMASSEIGESRRVVSKFTETQTPSNNENAHSMASCKTPGNPRPETLKAVCCLPHQHRPQQPLPHRRLLHRRRCCCRLAVLRAVPTRQQPVRLAAISHQQPHVRCFRHRRCCCRRQRIAPQAPQPLAYDAAASPQHPRLHPCPQQQRCRCAHGTQSLQRWSAAAGLSLARPNRSNGRGTESERRR